MAVLRSYDNKTKVFSLKLILENSDIKIHFKKKATESEKYVLFLGYVKLCSTNCT